MNFEVDGKLYKTEKKGVTVLQACLDVGISIPRFCFHDKLTIAGNCRMCLVEVSANPRSKKPIASCALPLNNQMVIYTNTIMVRKARESVLEFLLANHPLDCPICDQGGECDLQDQSFFFGNDKARFYENKRAVSDKYCGPFIKTIMTRCIHCTRCVRFATEIGGIDFFGTTGRGSFMEIGTYVEKIFNSELSGNIIDLCPVGALTSKTYAFVTRPWELRSIDSIDVFDTFGSRIRIDLRGLDILRILPSYNKDINEEWITDKVRFCYDGLNKQRFVIPLLKNFENFLFIEVSWVFSFCLLFNNLMFFYFQNLNNYNDKKFIFSAILGNIIDLQIIFILKKFLNFFNSSNNIISQDLINNLSFDFLNHFFLLNYKFLENKLLDGIFLFSLNPRLEMPLFNLRLRKNFNENKLFIGVFGYVTNLTYFVYDCGNNLKDLVKFVHGKHLVCRKVILLNNPIFLFGSNFINSFIKEFKFFFINFTQISKFLKPLNLFSFYYNFKIILTKSGLLNFISLKNLGFCKNFALVNFLINSDIFLISSNAKLFLKNYYIYIGSNGNSDADYSDLVLPSNNFVESSELFLNLEGKLQSTQYVIKSPNKNRQNWRIIYDLYFYILKNFFLNINIKFLFYDFNSNFLFLRNFRNNKLDKFLNLDFLRKLIFLYFNSLNKNLNFYFPFFYFYNFFNSFYLFNNIFIVNNFNFYKSDPITRSSKFMNLGFLEFENLELNFVY